MPLVRCFRRGLIRGGVRKSLRGSVGSLLLLVALLPRAVPRARRIPPHCDDGIVDQLSPIFGECDWAALAAPTWVQFQHGRKDDAFCPDADASLLRLQYNTGIMPQEEYDALFAEVERAWRVAGAPERVETYYHPDVHKVDNERAFKFISAGLEAGN